MREASLEAPSAQRQEGQRRSGFGQLGLPVRIGLVCAAAGLILALVGIFRGSVPLNPQSIFLALLISGGSWGLVSWAIATAAVDVETEVSEQEAAELAGSEPVVAKVKVDE
jgi:hypothetical protein